MTGFVFTDKPEGITSFTCVSRVKRALNTKKAGHTGTLDPMATGVMVIALGGATRFIDFIEDTDKVYEGSAKLGVRTDTLDTTGKITEESDSHITRAELEKAFSSFEGKILQIPPMYSAVKKDGVRLYELARKGVEVQRQGREIEVYSSKLLDFDEKEQTFEFQFCVSSGTYIRQIIGDMGDLLGCGAAMSSLRRTRANGVNIDRCATADDITPADIVPVWEMFDYEKLTVSPKQALRFSNGGELDTERLEGKTAENERYLVFSPDNMFLGIGRTDGENKVLSVARVYRET